MTDKHAKRKEELRTALDKINGNIAAWSKLRRRQPLSCDEMFTIQRALEEAIHAIDEAKAK